MYNKIFIPYWKMSTFLYKPIGPYYRWLWRSPGKKAIFLVVMTIPSIMLQIKMLDKWLNRGATHTPVTTNIPERG